MNKDNAVSFLTLVTSGNIEEAYEKYIAEDFIHHNPHFAGDRESLKRGMLENERTHPNKVFEVKHVLEDGDLVAVHSHLRFKEAEAGMIVLHLMRFKNEKIVEMWDIGQEIPEAMQNGNRPF